VRILALADIHGEDEVLDRLRVHAHNPRYDHIVICGDLTNRGPVSYAEDLLDIVEGKSLFAVHGNMDPPEVAELLEERGVSVHGKKKKLGEWNIVGLGGSNKTPFGTPSEMTEDEIKAVIDKAKLDKFSIFVSHPPPKGVLDTVGGDVHVGSEAVRKAIDEKKPIIAICGHIHEHEGQELVGETMVVKLKPAMMMRAAEIRIENGIEVNFIDL
jgi:Icc-related predicted phosphoesterase